MTRPTLIVPGNPADWLPKPPTGECRCRGECHGGHTFSLGSPPVLSWVPVDELPSVQCEVCADLAAAGVKGDNGCPGGRRPLRAGDVVTLAAFEGWPHVPVAFATAKAVEVLKVFRAETARFCPVPCIIVYPDGVGVWRSGDDTPEILTEDPGDWSSARFGVRLEDVEALT